MFYVLHEDKVKYLKGSCHKFSKLSFVLPQNDKSSFITWFILIIFSYCQERIDIFAIDFLEFYVLWRTALSSLPSTHGSICSILAD